MIGLNQTVFFIQTKLIFVESSQILMTNLQPLLVLMVTPPPFTGTVHEQLNDTFIIFELSLWCFIFKYLMNNFYKLWKSGSQTWSEEALTKLIGVGNILAFQSMKLKGSQLTFDPQLTEIFQEGSGSYKGMSDILEKKFKATIKKIRKENKQLYSLIPIAMNTVS